MDLKRFCNFILFTIFMIVAITVIHFYWPIHQKSEPIKCILPNSADGHCVELSSCPNVNKDFINPHNIEDIRIRNKICNSAGDEFVCCEAEKNFTFIFEEQSPNGLNLLEKHQNFKLFDLRKCGMTEKITSLNSRIAGGDDANLFEFPWAVQLKYLKNGEINNICGGTLISEYFVLTAAHCFDKFTDEIFFIRLGEYDEQTEKDCRNDNNCADPVQDIEVDPNSVIIHPNYDRQKIIHDIALIRLNQPAKLTQNNIRTICLPFNEKSLKSNHNYTVIGWGMTEFKSSHPILQKAVLPHFDFDECKNKYFVKEKNITDYQICAGIRGNVDACTGDSGMALQANRGAQMIQYGIVSYGAGKCKKVKKYPGVYTKVSKYLEWILDNMN